MNGSVCIGVEAHIEAAVCIHPRDAASCGPARAESGETASKQNLPIHLYCHAIDPWR